MDRVLFKKLYFSVVLGVFVLVGGVTQVHAVDVGGISVQGNAANNTPTFNSSGVQINDVSGSNNSNTVSAGDVQLNNPSVTTNGGINISNSKADNSNSSVKLGGQEVGTYVQPKAGDVKKKKDFGCGVKFWAVECIIQGLYYITLAPIAFIMGISGIIFDLSIEYSILKISSFVNDNSGSIYLAWSTVRDVCNLLFIGVLLYAAIDTILGGGNAKKIIISVITAALLINFSLFFTKILIDASNIVSLQFYNAASGGSSMSLEIMQLTKNVTLYSPNQTPSVSSAPGTSQINSSYGNGGSAQLIVGIIMSALFMLITSFVFLAGAILFAIRFAILLVLLATSPIAYVGSTLPKLDSMVGKIWWESLWNQLIFSPAYMFMMWLSVKVLQQMSDIATANGTASNLNLAQNQNLIINFLIVITFMLASVIIAKKLGASGASFAQGIAGGATIGASAWLGRNTVGKYANMITNSEKFKEFAARNPLGLGKLSKKGLDRVSSSSFDMRKPLKNVVGVDIGSTKSKGYVKDKEKSNKETAEFAQFVGKGEGGEARVGTFLSGQYGPKTIQNKIASKINELGDNLNIIGKKNAEGSLFNSFNEKLAKEDSELTKKAQEEWDKNNINKLKERQKAEEERIKTANVEPLKLALAEKQEKAKKPEKLIAAEAKLAGLTSGAREHAEAEEKVKALKVELKYKESPELENEIKELNEQIAAEEKKESAKLKEIKERIKKAEGKKAQDEEVEKTKKAFKELEKEKEEQEKEKKSNDEVKKDSK